MGATYVPVERRVHVIVVVLGVRIDENSGGSPCGSIIHLGGEDDEQMSRHVSRSAQGCRVRADLLSKADLPSSQQQNAAIDLDAAVMQNVQILQAAVVAVHQSPLQARTHAQFTHATWLGTG